MGTSIKLCFWCDFKAPSAWPRLFRSENIWNSNLTFFLLHAGGRSVNHVSNNAVWEIPRPCTSFTNAFAFARLQPPHERDKSHELRPLIQWKSFLSNRRRRKTSENGVCVHMWLRVGAQLIFMMSRMEKFSPLTTTTCGKFPLFERHDLWSGEVQWNLPRRVVRCLSKLIFSIKFSASTPTSHWLSSYHSWA